METPNREPKNVVGIHWEYTELPGSFYSFSIPAIFLGFLVAGSHQDPSIVRECETQALDACHATLKQRGPV